MNYKASNLIKMGLLISLIILTLSVLGADNRGWKNTDFEDASPEIKELAFFVIVTIIFNILIMIGIFYTREELNKKLDKIIMELKE